MNVFAPGEMPPDPKPIPRPLIDHALALMARQELPLRPYARVNAGFGKHEPCRLCARPIDPSQARYRVPDPQGLGINAMMFHVHCYLAWEAAARGE